MGTTITNEHEQMRRQLIVELKESMKHQSEGALSMERQTQTIQTDLAAQVEQYRTEIQEYI